MPINDLPLLSALRTRMQWHQERQRVLAENIANSDTPKFRPRDLVEPKFNSQRRERPRVAGDDPHQRRRICAGSGGLEHFEQNARAGFETRPAGNAVSLEDEMLKVVDQPDGLRRRDLALQPSLGC